MGLSQLAFGRRTQVIANDVREWEHGVAEPSPAMLTKLQQLVADTPVVGMALITGAVTGLSMALFRSSIVTMPGFIAGTQLQLVLILTLSLISALVTVILARKQFTSRFHPPGEAGRLGIQAGVFCALWAGAVLAALATWDASGADSAALDRALRSRMWLVFSVSLAALLPSVLCGFVGGLIGGFNYTGPSAVSL